MFVCLCKGVTDTQIRESINAGAASLRDVRKELGVATQCCKCLPLARSIIDEAITEQLCVHGNNSQPLAEPLFYSA